MPPTSATKQKKFVVGTDEGVDENDDVIDDSPNQFAQYTIEDNRPAAPAPSPSPESSSNNNESKSDPIISNGIQGNSNSHHFKDPSTSQPLFESSKDAANTQEKATVNHSHRDSKSKFLQPYPVLDQKSFQDFRNHKHHIPADSSSNRVLSKSLTNAIRVDTSTSANPKPQNERHLKIDAGNVTTTTTTTTTTTGPNFTLNSSNLGSLDATPNVSHGNDIHNVPDPTDLSSHFHPTFGEVILDDDAAGEYSSNPLDYSHQPQFPPPSGVSRTQQKLLLQRQHFLADDENFLIHPRNQLRLTKEIERINREYESVLLYRNPMLESMQRVFGRYALDHPEVLEEEFGANYDYAKDWDLDNKKKDTVDGVGESANVSAAAASV